ALWPLAGALVAALGLHWSSGDVSQLGVVLTGLAGALVLANSRSLALSLVTVSLGAALYLVVLVQWAPQQFDTLLAMFLPFFEQVKQASTESLLAKADPRQLLIEGMGLMTGVAATAALLLARWLQARLYNPGGFRTEFHQLRLGPGITGALALGMLVAQW